MKKTLKVSIGSIAFVVEEDAYEILNEYLTLLQEFYKDKEEGNEIIADVEARMSELLQIRITSSNNIITPTEAEEIIQIMGNPREFDTEDENSVVQDKGDSKKSKDKTPFYQKKLFRDSSNSVIGGVCSGLAYYFRIDPVLIRIIFIALLFIFSLISSKLVWFIILSYVILWAVMPNARTFSQKLSMIGKDPSLEGIINGDGNMSIYNPKSTRIGSTLLQIIKIITAVVLIIIGISFLISTVAFIGYFAWFDYPTAFGDLLGIVALDTFDVKFSLILLFVLPAILLIYFGIKMFSKVTTRDFIFALVILVICAGSGIYLAAIGGKTAVQYKAEAEVKEYLDLDLKADTLFINLAPEYKNAYLAFAESDLDFYKIENETNNSFFFTPQISIKKDSTLVNPKIEIKKKAYARTQNLAQVKAENAKLDYAIADSVITISPETFTKDKGFQREFIWIEITIPSNKEVKLGSLLSQNWRNGNYVFEDFYYGLNF